MDYKVLRIESYPVNWYEQKRSAISERGQEYGLPLLRLDPAQGRFRHAGGVGGEVR